MVKFDEELTVVGGMVTATGPYDPSKEEIIELCAWVFQPDKDDKSVRAATEMTQHHGNAHRLLRQEGDEELWFCSEHCLREFLASAPSAA